MSRKTSRLSFGTYQLRVLRCRSGKTAAKTNATLTLGSYLPTLSEGSRICMQRHFCHGKGYLLGVPDSHDLDDGLSVFNPS